MRLLTEVAVAFPQAVWGDSSEDEDAGTCMRRDSLALSPSTKPAEREGWSLSPAVPADSPRAIQPKREALPKSPRRSDRQDEAATRDDGRAPLKRPPAGLQCVRPQPPRSHVFFVSRLLSVRACSDSAHHGRLPKSHRFGPRHIH